MAVNSLLGSDVLQSVRNFVMFWRILSMYILQKQW